MGLMLVKICKYCLKCTVSLKFTTRNLCHVPIYSKSGNFFKGLHYPFDVCWNICRGRTIHFGAESKSKGVRNLYLVSSTPWQNQTRQTDISLPQEDGVPSNAFVSGHGGCLGNSLLAVVCWLPQWIMCLVADNSTLYLGEGRDWGLRNVADGDKGWKRGDAVAPFFTGGVSAVRGRGWLKPNSFSSGCMLRWVSGLGEFL